LSGALSRFAAYERIGVQSFTVAQFIPLWLMPPAVPLRFMDAIVSKVRTGAKFKKGAILDGIAHQEGARQMLFRAGGKVKRHVFVP
jgi:hypothetical protein